MEKRLILALCLTALAFSKTLLLAQDAEGLMPSFFYYERSPRVTELLKSNTNWSGADDQFYFEIALDHFDKDRIGESLWGLERAVGINSNVSSIRLWLGKSYARKASAVPALFRARWARKSVVEFRVAVRIDPDNIEARRALIGHYETASALCGGDKKMALVERERLKERLASKGRSPEGRLQD